jgi:putative hydrolase of the HAD superfamily
MRPEVILFDFFGTLVTYEADRTAITYERTHALLADHGSVLSHDEFVTAWDLASRRVEDIGETSHVEHSMLDIVHVLADDLGLDADAGWLDSLIETFLAEWAVPVTLVPGCADVLRGLAEGHRLGVVSNTNDSSMVPALLERFDVADCFDHVLLSVDHGFRKPHPSIYEAALDLFGCRPSDAVFVGDTYEADYLGPSAAGLRPYLIDPDRHRDVPDERRLDTVLDLRGRFSSASPLF